MCGENGTVGQMLVGLEVHPHVCGENVYRCGIRATASRYTPTCVGKTLHVGEPGDGLQVHPHVCGENVCSLRTLLAARGTPPRVWGKHTDAEPGGTFDRYTPTCVGKTVFH